VEVHIYPAYEGILKKALIDREITLSSKSCKPIKIL